MTRPVTVLLALATFALIVALPLVEWAPIEVAWGCTVGGGLVAVVAWALAEVAGAGRKKS